MGVILLISENFCLPPYVSFWYKAFFSCLKTRFCIWGVLSFWEWLLFFYGFCQGSKGLGFQQTEKVQVGVVKNIWLGGFMQYINRNGGVWGGPAQRPRAYLSPFSQIFPWGQIKKNNVSPIPTTISPPPTSRNQNSSNKSFAKPIFQQINQQWFPKLFVYSEFSFFFIIKFV